MTTYFKKQGRRYIPVAESEVRWESMPLGTHLVDVKPGCTTWMYNVEVDNAKVLKAMLTAKEAMTKALMDANHMEPKTIDVPERDKEKYMQAWKAWSEIVGEMPLVFAGLSPAELVDAGIKALKEELDKDSENENRNP